MNKRWFNFIVPHFMIFDTIEPLCMREGHSTCIAISIRGKI